MKRILYFDVSGSRARAKLDVTLLGTRGEGVGAEFPDEPPPSKDGKKPPQSSRESPKANKAFSSATAAAVAAADADGGNNACEFQMLICLTIRNPDEEKLSFFAPCTADHPSSSSTEDYNSRVTSRKVGGGRCFEIQGQVQGLALRLQTSPHTSAIKVYL